MALIRALTFFLPIEDMAKYEDSLNEYINWMDNILRDFPYDAWTKRIVLPPIPNRYSARDWGKIIDYIIDNISIKKVLLHGMAININDKKLGEYIGLLRQYNYLFGNILYTGVAERTLSRLYSLDDPDLYTRIAITFGDYIETPYFPATTNKENIFGFAIALRYIDLMKSYLEGDKDHLSSYLNEMDMKLSGFGALYLGIDLSLSPWMEESVAKLLEDIYGCMVGRPGSYYAVHKLNEIIVALVRDIGLKTLGFNEVMLPVGEDNRLMELVENGQLRLQDLIGLTSVCVAGLDMVVVPNNPRLICGVAEDLYAISRARGKSMAMRIIPSPSDRVYIERFGEIPRISID